MNLKYRELRFYNDIVIGFDISFKNYCHFAYKFNFLNLYLIQPYFFSNLI